MKKKFTANQIGVFFDVQYLLIELISDFDFLDADRKL